MANAGSVDIKGLTAVERELKQLRRFMPLEVRQLNSIAEIFKSEIKSRTLKGRDVEGKPFTPYSPDYAVTRAEAGRGTKIVNLFWFGHMSAAMAHRATKSEIRIYFRSVKEGLKAHGLHFGSPKTGLPERLWFDVNNDDMNKVMAYLEKQYGR